MEVGKDLNIELAQAFIDRGICAVYTPELQAAVKPEIKPDSSAKPATVASK